jgi:hypothetical protein
MNRFSNDRRALDFIASPLAEEGRREGVAFVVEGVAENSNSSHHRRNLVCWPDLRDKQAFS